MHEQPSVRELVQAVKNFVDETAMPELQGRAGFHARVASNVLATILRDLECRAESDAKERSSLQALLGLSDEHDLTALNYELSRRIRENEIDLVSAELMQHLKMTAIDQIRVDQPNYSGLKTALKDS